MATLKAKAVWKKNYEKQFHKPAVGKTLFEKRAEALGLTSDDQIRNSKKMQDWARRYFETRWIPEWFLSTLKIVPSDEKEYHGSSHDLPRFRAETYKEFMQSQ